MNRSHILLRQCRYGCEILRRAGLYISFSVCLFVCPLAYLRNHTFQEGYLPHFEIQHFVFVYLLAVSPSSAKKNRMYVRSYHLTDVCTVQKRLKRSRCRLGGRLMCRDLMNRLLNGIEIPPRERAIFGVVRPTEKHWESLLRCTQQKSSFNPQ